MGGYQQACAGCNSISGILQLIQVTIVELLVSRFPRVFFFFLNHHFVPSFKFIDFDLTDDDTCKAAIRMFLECNLVQKFQIPYHVSKNDHNILLKFSNFFVLSP